MSITILVILVCVQTVCMFPDDHQNEANLSPGKNKSIAEVEVFLTSPSGDAGVVAIRLPNENATRPICYPKTYLEQQQAAKFLHVLCKAIGYVTFDSKHMEEYEQNETGIVPTSAHCTSHEDSVSKCHWDKVKVRQCREVLATRCSTCNKKIVAENGSISNPGFPHTYLYSLMCEWKIEVPGSLDIQLHFEQFSLPRTDMHACEAYVELTYGNQKVTSQRLCPDEHVDKIFIPYGSARIRFSSGIYRQAYEIQQARYGFNIIFRADLREEQSFQPIMITVLVVLSIFLITFLCHYFCRRNNNESRILPVQQAVSLEPNAPSQIQLQSAFEIQRNALKNEHPYKATPYHKHPKNHIAFKNIPLEEVAVDRVPPANDTTYVVKFSIFQSESSSVDSAVARWKSVSDLPVTTALAPLGPRKRELTFVSTPRSVFPRMQKWSEDNAQRFQHLRTKLVTRFASNNRLNQSDISVFLSSSERKSYSLLENEFETGVMDPFIEETRTNIVRSNSEPAQVPSIVVEHVI